MKNVKKINLTQLNKIELSERELNRLLGGNEHCCVCGCAGPSSAQDNNVANYEGGTTGLWSPGGGVSHGNTF